MVPKKTKTFSLPFMPISRNWQDLLLKNAWNREFAIVTNFIPSLQWNHFMTSMYRVFIKNLYHQSLNTKIHDSNRKYEKKVKYFCINCLQKTYELSAELIIISWMSEILVLRDFLNRKLEDFVNIFLVTNCPAIILRFLAYANWMNIFILFLSQT